MFCTKCGMKNEDDALFCAGCGSPISKPQNVQPVETKQESQGVNLAKEVTETVTPEVSVESVDETVSNVQENVVEENVQVESVEPQTFTAAQGQGMADNFSQPQNDVQQSFSQSQNFSQPQGFGQQQSFSQPQGFNQQQNYNQPQNFGQPQYAGRQFSGSQPVNQNKFSVKRFIFSAIIVIASIVACFGIAFTYVGLEMKTTIEGEKDTEKEYVKGYKIIKEDVGITDEDDFGMIDFDDVVDTAKTFRYVVIAFEVSMIAFAIIDIILLTAVRKRAAYVFVMLFSIIKAALGGVAIYLWCIKLVGDFKKMLDAFMEGFASYGDFSIKLTATVGIGLILSLVLQAVILICSIVLLTCKNRQKVQTQM